MRRLVAFADSHPVIACSIAASAAFAALLLIITTVDQPVAPANTTGSATTTAPAAAPAPPPAQAAALAPAASAPSVDSVPACDLDPEPVSDEDDAQLAEILGGGTAKPARSRSPAERKRIAIEIARDECVERLLRGAIGQARVNTALFGNNDDISVSWFIADSITTGWAADGAKVDVYKALRAVAGSPLEYRRIHLVGIYPLKDEYGRTRNQQVVDVEYTKDTIGKIDFSGIGVANIYNVVDGGQVHPDFQ